MHPPCPPYKNPAHYEIECLLVDILDEERLTMLQNLKTND
jgi:hypothetical protein